ncbi:hypothetical protein OpiT1DRAFT_00178 [Opitutaceae bacterium TAV1]|nr:hypothetical protein OpiT1DRAFT_00178 [Opitutaceae bacterium TAV1]
MLPGTQTPPGKVRRAVWRGDSRGRNGRFVEEFVDAASVPAAAWMPADVPAAVPSPARGRKRAERGKYALREKGGLLRIVERETGIVCGIAATRKIGEQVVDAENRRACNV